MAIVAPHVVGKEYRPEWQRCILCTKWRALPQTVKDLEKRGIHVDGRTFTCEVVRLSCDIPQLLPDKAIDFWLGLTKKIPKTSWVCCDSCNSWRCLPEDQMDSETSKTNRWVCENIEGLTCGVRQVFPPCIVNYITRY